MVPFPNPVSEISAMFVWVFVCLLSWKFNSTPLKNFWDPKGQENSRLPVPSWPAGAFAVKLPGVVYMMQSHRIHAWYISLHLVDFHGKYRYIYHTWILWDVFQWFKKQISPRHFRPSAMTFQLIELILFFRLTFSGGKVSIGFHTKSVQIN